MLWQPALPQPSRVTSEPQGKPPPSTASIAAMAVGKSASRPARGAGARGMEAGFELLEIDAYRKHGSPS